MDIWVKVFKNRQSKICGRQPLKNLNPYFKPSKSYLIVKEKHLEGVPPYFFRSKSILWTCPLTIKVTNKIIHQILDYIYFYFEICANLGYLVDKLLKLLCLIADFAQKNKPNTKESHILCESFFTWETP